MTNCFCSDEVLQALQELHQVARLIQLSLLILLPFFVSYSFKLFQETLQVVVTVRACFPVGVYLYMKLTFLIDYLRNLKGKRLPQTIDHTTKPNDDKTVPLF